MPGEAFLLRELSVDPAHLLVHGGLHHHRRLRRRRAGLPLRPLHRERGDVRYEIGEQLEVGILRTPSFRKRGPHFLRRVQFRDVGKH